MFKKIAIALLVIILGILAFATTRPDTFRVERSISINAPADQIFPFVNDFRAWRQWSPFENLDTAMERTYLGSDQGVGAVYEWDGSRKVGQGRMEIVESVPSSRIAIQLDFLKPMKSSNTTEFTFVPQGDATTVTWAMFGPQSYMTKVMCIFVSIDKMIGKDFQAGLERLKTVVEQQSEQAAPIVDSGAVLTL